MKTIKKGLNTIVFSILVSAMVTIASVIPPKERDFHNNEWITIFVHGSVGNSLYLKYFFTLFKRDISNTSYCKLTQHYRNDKKWIKNHAAQELGLKKIDFNARKKGAAQLFALLYETMQKKFFPEQKSLGYYTFGWSGLVNHKQRCLDAANFYKELKQLMAQIRQEHPHTKIRIVTYSHGGNVALNMVKELKNDPNSRDFIINELIMIATPIQKETDCYALDPFFEKIYSIYSRADCVQKSDCFSTGCFFSGRTLCDNSRCPCGKAAQQIQLKISMAAHKDLKVGSTTTSKKRIDRSPGHIELWYFADLCECECNGQYEPCFESKLYRTYFPLEPLPAAILAPGIIATAQRYSPYTANLVFDVQPDTGKAVLREKHTSKKQTVDFISAETLDDMRANSFPYLNKYPAN